MRTSRSYCRVLAFATAIMIGLPALALDKMKVAVGQRGGWPTSVPEVAQKYGFFSRNGLDVEVLYTNGGGETIQPVIAGAVDVGVAVGTSAAMGVYQKGAPLRIIANQTTGASDIVWYVDEKSPIKTYQDFDGRTLSYSSTGSASHVLALALGEHFGVKPKLVTTGDMAGTLTQVLSGQVDVGWLAPPVGLDAARTGRTRLIGSAGVIPKYKDQTVRVQVVHPAILAAKKDLIARYLRAYRETADWMYTEDPEMWKAFVAVAGVPVELLRKTRDDYYPKASIHPDTITGLDGVMADGVAYKFMTAPLTREQLGELFVALPR